ncbi:hypothetical protein A11A3_09160 [Alcanivorax hongdengensis A-11-3]|uniref:Inositolphosphotransferase Aur1/Ipt1 domain-containing protein n=1 Tax=Alcanivorax hongdengensis A-11-3 TaxID=1177179 RepID=L0WDW1_9GAMM|nr:phosphatase PAP2 family protein [Alcanivorax hongdengensis]EKF74357.1 hypothetical protein A11A3_09160 [Alcanivorax hongdengensis A-11-3]
MNRWGSPLDRFLLATVAGFAVLVYGVTAYFRLPYRPVHDFYSLPLLFGTGFFVLGFFCFRLLRMMLLHRGHGLLKAAWRDVWSFVSWPRFCTALPVLLLIPVFFSVFTTMKNAIPALQPFYLDPALAELDQRLHAGTQPWQWLQPLLGIPLVTMLISAFYKSWFFFKYGMVCWQAFSLADPQRRARFFVTLLLCWILLGVVLATLLSSAGPCFYGGLYPQLPNPYAGLMTYLHQADSHYPVFDLFAQHYLWRAYQGHVALPFSGISAMPSMHVSMATLFLLLCWQKGRVLRWLLGGYLLLIQVGSVMLGWHYAVDGYLAMIMTGLLWWVAGCWVRRWRFPMT